MKAPALFLTTLLLALAAPATTADAHLVDATLELDLADHDYKTCEVSIPAGASHAAVLDAAVETGCISSWTAIDYGFGRFVDCIDDVCGQSAAIFVGTYWGYYVNGGYASTGIDGQATAEGDIVRFNYETYAFVPL